MNSKSEIEVLNVKNVKKSYGSFAALDNISFSLKKGEIVGLLGHNGAGKSTLIKCIMGAIKSYDGNILYCGDNIINERKQFVKEVGILLEPSFVDYLSARENLYLISRAIGKEVKLETIDELLEMVSLKKAAKKKVSEFSFGMKQRLGLAQAMINNPKMIILDEPTVGLDPTGTEVIKRALLEMAGKGAAIMFSSHELPAIEDICSRIIVIEEGKLIYDDSIDKVKAKEIVIVTEENLKDIKSLLAYGDDVYISGTSIVVKKIEMIDSVITIVKDSGLKILDITSKENSLFKFFDGGVRK